MAVADGSYDSLPAPPVAQTGALVIFDGRAPDPGGAYLYDNSLVTMAGYQNAFPNFIVGWPDTVSSNYEGQGDYGSSPYGTPVTTAHHGNYTDQNSIPGVPQGFIAA